jgi:hypothetical protein
MCRNNIFVVVVVVVVVFIDGVGNGTGKTTGMFFVIGELRFCYRRSGWSGFGPIFS